MKARPARCNGIATPKSVDGILDSTMHFMAVTSDDEIHDHRCKWKDTKNVVCEPLHAGMGGQPITEDLGFTFDKGTMSFNSIVTMKDGAKVVFEAKGSR